MSEPFQPAPPTAPQGTPGGPTIGRIIASIPCYLGYLWMLWDKESQTWHDKIANDVVVPTSAYPVERWP